MNDSLKCSNGGTVPTADEEDCAATPGNDEVDTVVDTDEGDDDDDEEEEEEEEDASLLVSDGVDGLRMLRRVPPPWLHADNGGGRR